MFSETSVLTRATWYRVPEGIYNHTWFVSWCFCSVLTSEMTLNCHNWIDRSLP
jgi:hypothetical protein